MPASAAAAPVISCAELSFSYGRGEAATPALDKVSLEVERDAVLALIGPNGSGKSTLLNIMLGLHPPDAGAVTVEGYVPWRDREKLTADVTFVSDVASLPRWIRVGALAKLMARVHPRFKEDFYLELLERARLPLGRECGSFSKGQLAYIHLALALAVDARLLILDEPTLGLDVAARRHFHDRLLVDYCKGGRSLVITTHYPDELAGLVTHVAFMKRGRLVLKDTVDGLAERFKVISVAAAERERAEALGPLYTQMVLGGTSMLFDLRQVELAQLQGLGAGLSGATLSDIYLAYVAGEGGEVL